MMTVHKLSAGDGYTYYTREVASGDELRTKDRSLGDYYTVDGNPPGQWGGGGAALLGVSGGVSEVQMAALFGEGLHFPGSAFSGPPFQLKPAFYRPRQQNIFRVGMVQGDAS